MGISEQSTFNFLVSNLAKFSLDVNFEVTGPSELLQHLEAKPQNAVIEVGKQLKLPLVFYPQNICNLQDIKLRIKVRRSSSRYSFGGLREALLFYIKKPFKYINFRESSEIVVNILVVFE